MYGLSTSVISQRIEGPPPSFSTIFGTTPKFVEPSLETTTAAAAEAAATMPEDMRVSITDPPGENAYPIAGYTYILVYKDQKDEVKGKALAEFLWWAIHDGEKYAKDLLYAPLPENVVKKAEEKIKQINYQGTPFIR